MVGKVRTASSIARTRVKAGKRTVTRTLKGFNASEEVLRKRTAELIREMRKAKVPVSPKNLAMLSNATLDEMVEYEQYAGSNDGGAYTWSNAARNTIMQLKREKKFEG